MVSAKLQGGLANNLFQICTVLAYGLKHNMDYCIPITVSNPHSKYQQPYIFCSLQYKYDDSGLSLPVYKQTSFSYTEIPYMEDVCLDGYFQSFLFFNDYREQILKMLDFNWHCELGWIGIHLRFGDYLTKPDCHPIVTNEYLTMAMNFFRQKGYQNFHIFSDNLRMASEKLMLITRHTDNLMFSRNRSEIEDMQLLSCMEHQIISNSSFGLFAYWLNENVAKICVAPKVWFGKDLEYNNTRDLYPPNCIIL